MLRISKTLLSVMQCDHCVIIGSLEIKLVVHSDVNRTFTDGNFEM